MVELYVRNVMQKKLENKEQWYHRWAPSLGGLEGKPEDVWGTLPYNSKEHIDKPTVFCGLYGLPDFYAMWRHRGRKAAWWAGSDIRHFIAGYWLDDEGETHIRPEGMAQWINKYCESWVENEVEQTALANIGIYAYVCPSFMGNIDDYPVSFEANGKYYASVSGDDFKLYKWDAVEELAKGYPELEFHLYGNTVPWVTKNKNVIVHGRVPKEEMNEEVKHMTGGIRLLEFDGASEITVKSILWGQYPISVIKYPGTTRPEDISLLEYQKEPNLKAREWWIENLNQYPWNSYAKRSLQTVKPTLE